MKTNITFSMIKPDIVRNQQAGAVITVIENAGFRLQAMKLIQLTKASAEDFYEMHQMRPFYQELCQYIASEPVVAMILEKENAVSDFRKLIGLTNPVEAAEGTIRRKFGKSMQANAIHGTDTQENVAIEIKKIFDKTYLN